MGKVRPFRINRSATESGLLRQAVLNKRRITLKKILLRYMGLTLTREQPDLLLEDIKYAGLGAELLAVEEAMGLDPGDMPRQAGNVDIEVNGVAIALDDEVRFNRFRLKTLQSPVYNMPLICNLTRYKAYCQESRPGSGLNFPLRGTRDRLHVQKFVFRENSFLKKQAIHDFMQDLLPLVHFVPVLRLSVYDQLETPEGPKSLHTLLMEDSPRHFELLADHLMAMLEDLEEAFNLEY